MKSKLKKLINYHYNWYPKLQIEDLYKMIYQSVMGPEHILQDETKAFQSLKNEMEKNIGKEKILFRDIGLENDMVRVNLNIFKEKIGNLQKLFHAMKKTAKSIRGDKSKVQNVWKQVGEMFAFGELPFLCYPIWQEFTELLQKRGFPPVSHSAIYKKNYYPSYRIVLKKYLHL